MDTDDIKQLASLARIKLTEEEKTALAAELPQIVEYVSAVREITGSADEQTPTVGARYNVFRPDEVLHEPNQFTDAILAEMPATDGRYMKVKKILNQDE